MRTVARLLLVGLALGAAACERGDLGNGLLACSPDQRCPSGYHCEVDNRCWLDGTAPMPDLGPPPIVILRPATQWTCGGGGATSDPSGSRLNVSIGGTSFFGGARAPSGAVVDYSLFSSGRY